MPKFKVTVKVAAEFAPEVEADDEENAIEQAQAEVWSLFFSGHALEDDMMTFVVEPIEEWT
ncbi:MAG: hypothetical protein ABIJ75_07205 [Actinomycetota bacterium]